MHTFFLEITITLTDGNTIWYEESDGDAACPIDIRNARSVFKKDLAALTTGESLADYITGLSDDKECLNSDSDYQTFCKEVCSIDDFSKFKRLDIEILEGVIDEEAYRGKLGYDFITGKGSKSYKEIDPDEFV